MQAARAGTAQIDRHNAGVRKVLAGERAWDPRRGALLPFLQGVVDSSGEFKRSKFRRRDLSYQGRHGGPIANPERLRSTSMVFAVEPNDVAGVAGLGKRLNDWTAQDQAWFYVPATRRLRRIEATGIEDAISRLTWELGSRIARIARIR